MPEIIILITVFASVLLLTLAVASVVARNRAISRNIEEATSERPFTSAVDDMLATDNDTIRYYLEVQRSSKPDSIQMRLLTAGFLSRSAPRYFLLLRFAVAAASFAATQIVISRFAPATSFAILSLFSAIVGGVFFVMLSAVLDYLVDKAETSNRKLFPDFMDLLIVCVDAGLSIEAAVDRVAREFLQAKPSFGIQLAIISLEVRAGRSLHEALTAFSERIKLDEARTLATLFRQSQELGASVVKTLRTYAREMRQTRIIKAEEKANALPIKMLFPLAAFMFPVNLIIILVPVVMALLSTFASMQPPGG